jgi:DNA-binding transcriptional LysR family regulator
MELDNFEIIIHLVAMGLGASLVPRRALAAYPRKKALLRVPLKQRFEREIVILTRRTRVLLEFMAREEAHVMWTSWPTSKWST